MDIKVMLNRADNPGPFDRIFVGKGDTVYAKESAAQFGFRPEDAYKIKSISNYLQLVLENEEGKVGEYPPHHFYKY